MPRPNNRQELHAEKITSTFECGTFENSKWCAFVLHSYTFVGLLLNAFCAEPQFCLCNQSRAKFLPLLPPLPARKRKFCFGALHIVQENIGVEKLTEASSGLT